MQGCDVILGLLDRRDLTGYEIKSIIETRLRYFYDGTAGMIYPTLKRMEKQGFVTGRAVVQEGAPNKKVYAITATGREQLKSYLNSPVDEDIIKSDFLMRLY